MSDFLFAMPSAIDGVMSVIDLFGISIEYNSSSSKLQADRRAHQTDMNALRKDAEAAFMQVKDAERQANPE